MSVVTAIGRRKDDPSIDENEESMPIIRINDNPTNTYEVMVEASDCYWSAGRWHKGGGRMLRRTYTVNATSEDAARRCALSWTGGHRVVYAVSIDELCDDAEVDLVAAPEP